MAGLAVRDLVPIRDVVAVIHQLMALALEVLPLKNPHPVRTSMLLTEETSAIWSSLQAFVFP